MLRRLSSASASRAAASSRRVASRHRAGPRRRLPAWPGRRRAALPSTCAACSAAMSPAAIAASARALASSARCFRSPTSACTSGGRPRAALGSPAPALELAAVHRLQQGRFVGQLQGVHGGAERFGEVCLPGGHGADRLPGSVIPVASRQRFRPARHAAASHPAPRPVRSASTPSPPMRRPHCQALSRMAWRSSSICALARSPRSQRSRGPLSPSGRLPRAGPALFRPTVQHRGDAAGR